MSSPYVGEIRMFAGNFAPAGWMLCQGQLLPISEWEVLFNLIGTTYGGDGQETFALPDLQGRLPLHQGTNPNTGTTFAIGEKSGTETVTLTTQQIPQHSHAPQAQSGNATKASPTGNVWAAGTQALFATAAPNLQMNAQALQLAGGSQPHDNLMPYLAINFIISMFGVFPTQN